MYLPVDFLALDIVGWNHSQRRLERQVSKTHCLCLGSGDECPGIVSGMLTLATNVLATNYPQICSPKHFFSMQVGLTVVTTAILLFALSYVSEPFVLSSDDVQQQGGGQDERQLLLNRVAR